MLHCIIKLKKNSSGKNTCHDFSNAEGEYPENTGWFKQVHAKITDSNKT